jgi:pimeloyl-ACP methyl ester carboxylesterase
MENNEVVYGRTTLPAGVRSRFVPNGNGITMHVLEAGYETPGRPCVLLLHGYPELAYSWRKVLPVLAEAGYHAVAPDHRGYGRSDGTGPAYDDDLRPYSMIEHVKDTLGLVYALGYRSVAAVVGNDFGAPVAGWSALIRPDVFRSLVVMSPFVGGPSFNLKPPSTGPTVYDDLAALDTPRKHYTRYYATRAANGDMMNCRQGLHDFFRAYFHMKSADWPGNRPLRLASWSAAELAKLPRYYVMDLDKDMAETVAAEMPSPEAIAACRWLTDEELRVYSSEYARTGFQGGLQSYRLGMDPAGTDELRLFAGKTIDVPACFIGGANDWGGYQNPGRLERMQQVYTRLRGVHQVDGAGHWLQQEQPEAFNRLLLDFLAGLG